MGPVGLGRSGAQLERRYKITFQTDQKSGTSVAAKQSEQPYTAWYKLGRTVLQVPVWPRSSTARPPSKTLPEDHVRVDRVAVVAHQRLAVGLPLGDGTITFDAASSVTTYAAGWLAEGILRDQHR